MILEGDCVEAMAAMDEASVDAIVTDPPYGLEFMGKEWDRLAGTPGYNERGRITDRPDSQVPYGRGGGVNSYQAGRPMQEWHQAWATEALRILKPGGHLLAFGGTRTYHRLACAVEDAGFEIRDSLIWLYGSGFPKSLDVSKAIERTRGDGGATLAVTRWLQRAVKHSGLTRAEVMARGEWTEGQMVHWLAGQVSVHPGVPVWDEWQRLKEIIGFSDEMDAEVWRLNGRKGQPGEYWEKREKVGEQTKARSTDAASALPTMGADVEYRTWDVTAPATPEALKWQGWGTALKPAHEPIVVARKPLSGTVAQNVSEHGTGALNVDGCRVDATDKTAFPVGDYGDQGIYGVDGERTDDPNPAGRWPANVTLSHLPECERVGTRRVKGSAPASGPTLSATESVAHGEYNGARGAVPAYQDETIPSYNCAPGCPIAELDRQSGERPGATSNSHRARADSERSDACYGDYATTELSLGYGDTGGASRFFYCAKASRGERNAGLDGFEERENVGVRYTTMAGDGRENPEVKLVSRANVHPTVKPIDLMRWLVRLVTPPGGTVLDPFTGSGTTGVAATLEGVEFIGCELDPEYAEIARARIEWWSQFPPGTDIASALGLEAVDRVHRESGQIGLFG